MKFISHRKEVDAKVDSAIARMLEEWGMVAQGFATADTPVDTGRLRGSITYETDVESATTVIGTNVEYAPIVETNDKARHPVGKAHFMRDAIARHKDLYQAMAMEYLNNL